MRMSAVERALSLKTGTVGNRSRSARALAERLREIAPWFADTDAPMLRAFCELELIARRMFALIRKDGFLNAKGEVRKLVSEYRAIRSAQKSLADSLGLTPLARRELTSTDNDKGFDFAIEMTKVIDAEREDEAQHAPEERPDGHDET